MLRQFLIYGVEKMLQIRENISGKWQQFSQLAEKPRR
jgi:hypothetical protein